MGWTKMKLGEVLINREGRYKPNDPTIANLKRIDKINFSGQIFISNKGSNTDMILVKKGDLVISGINVEKGAITVYEGEEDITATIHYSSYIFNIDKIDIEFLKVFLRSPDFIQLLKEQVPGGIKTEIKPKHILPLEVFFPDKIEKQKEIAKHFFEKERKFNELDEHLKYQLYQLKNLNQAILQEAVQGKLVTQNPKEESASELHMRIRDEKVKSGKKEKPLPPIKPEEIPFDIPGNWMWCRLGEIAYVTSGSTPSKEAFVDEGIPYLKMYNLRNQEIDFHYKTQYIKEEIHNGQLKRCRAYPGDILMNIVGPPLGKIAIIPESLPECNFNQAAVLIRPMINDCNKYIFWFLNEMSEINAIDTKGVAGQDNISVTQSQLIKIPLPPLSEQKRIVTEIEKQLTKTKQLKEHIIANQQATEQLLKALLHQAFEVKENKAKKVQQTRGKVAEWNSSTPNWDNLVAEPFEKYAVHPVNNIQDIDWEMAMMVACMKNKLGVTYGDVGLQKNVYNTNNLQSIFSKQYAFANSNFGTYCHELKEDLKRNPYLIAQKVANNKEVYAVNPKYSKQVLDKLSATENQEFVQAINRMLSIYEHSFINKETDKIELYNTVLKVALDKNTRDIDSIYQGMEDWKINQTKYKTKAEKFSKLDAERMLKLLMGKKIL
ncbi:restriction endonuclease subunit S [Pedobacter sp. Du54]|uniref:restriction endonuclease subunit S n=1 Tax=Pedobacter anseongensis TaxID=3133439 RepID=UPI0030A88634